MQGKIKAQHEEKLASAAGKSGTESLKVWCKNPPYKCSDIGIKQTAYEAVCEAMANIDANAMKTMFGENGLDVNAAAHLNRYIHTCYELLGKKGKNRIF
jgi:hypothetical protein